jgi:arginyl-tRNA synthetase
MSIANNLKRLLKESIDSFYKIDIDTIQTTQENNNTEIYYSTNIISYLKEKTYFKEEELYNKIINNLPQNEIINKINLNNEKINITIKESYLTNNLKKILKQKEDYGKTTIGNNEKINIEIMIDNNIDDYLEYLIKMDTLSRIMDFCGYNIEKELYITNENIDIDLIKKEIDN